MINIILTLIILLIAGSAASYIYRAKKQGVHCVGCPNSKKCGGKSCNCK